MKIDSYGNFSYIFQDMMNALLRPDHGAKKLIVTFHLVLKSSAMFFKKLSLNIVVMSVLSYLKAIRKKN